MKVKMNNNDILDASLVPNQELNFENGLAIAKVNIKYRDFYNDVVNYLTTVVLAEKEEGEENEPYRLAGYGERYFSGERFVMDITRSGDDFFVEILTGEENVSWSVYKHYKAKRITDKTVMFSFLRKLPAKVIPTKQPNIGIIKPAFGKRSLYKIDEGEVAKNAYSSIEETEGGMFLVVDKIKSNLDDKFSDNFVFLIDKDDNIIGDILSRNNGMEIVKREPEESYSDVVNRKVIELDNLPYLEEEKKKELRMFRLENKEV